MEKRTLGRSGIKVSAIGLGCWQIGGMAPREGGKEHGWYGAEDRESIRAIHRALDLGVTFLDTADMYGIGHSERLLGEALAGRRDKVVIATKFGKTFDEARRVRTDHHDVRPEYIRPACEDSLRRLRTDVVDLYQLHDGYMELDEVPGVLDTLEGLVASGKIRGYGWSTNDPERAAAFATGAHCIAVQHTFNILSGNHDVLAAATRLGLASINRSPLGQGLLVGKVARGKSFERFDVRAGWDLETGKHARRLDGFEKIRDLLVADGRTLAQGALGWLLAISPITVPIPGFRNIQQIEDNCGVLAKGPLDAATMAAIEREVAGLR